jgi:flavin-dependent dehydrogenase
MIFDVGDFRHWFVTLWKTATPRATGRGERTLDDILVDAAIESGAELREGFAVIGLRLRQ